MTKRRRRAERPDDGWEPTFEDYLRAREVIIFVRKWLAKHGEHVNIGSCPVFSHILINGSPLADPEQFAPSQLASGEGQYLRSAAAHAVRAAAAEERAASESHG